MSTNYPITEVPASMPARIAEVSRNTAETKIRVRVNLDVLNAQREKTQALYSDADTRYGYQLSKVRLMIMTGDISAQQLTALHD